MYCRRCGKRLDDRATRYEHCDTDVVEVKQRPYAEKYREQREVERAQKAQERSAASQQQAVEDDQTAAYAAAAGIKRDRYVTPALLVGMLALGLSVFPWPAAWAVGTSLWMRILILALSLVGLVLCLLATGVENANVRAASAWNRGHKKRSFTYERPTTLLVARICCAVSALMAVLSFFAL